MRDSGDNYLDARRSELEKVRLAIAYGVSGYLVKPFNPANIQQKITVALTPVSPDPKLVSSTKILLVDDSTSMRTLMSSMLNELGFHNVVAVASAEEALAAVEGGAEIDIIVCDWYLPGMSGVELFQEVRNRYPKKRIPFVLVTAESSSEKICEVLRKGVNEYVLKPFSAGELYKKIVRALSEP